MPSATSSLASSRFASILKGVFETGSISISTTDLRINPSLKTVTYQGLFGLGHLRVERQCQTQPICQASIGKLLRPQLIFLSVVSQCHRRVRALSSSDALCFEMHHQTVALT